MLLRCGVCGKWTNKTKTERELVRVCVGCQPHVDQAGIALFDTDGIRPPTNDKEITRLNIQD